jgi:hypothetical protein
MAEFASPLIDADPAKPSTHGRPTDGHLFANPFFHHLDGRDPSRRSRCRGAPDLVLGLLDIGAAVRVGTARAYRPSAAQFRKESARRVSALT